MVELLFLLIIIGAPALCIYFYISDLKLVMSAFTLKYPDVKRAYGKPEKVFSATVYSIAGHDLSIDKVQIAKNPNCKVEIFDNFILFRYKNRCLIIKDLSELKYSASPLIYGKTLEVNPKNSKNLRIYLSPETLEGLQQVIKIGD